MNYQDAVANVTWLYASYVSRYAGNLNDAVNLLQAFIEKGGWSVQKAYDEVTSAVLHDAAFYDNAFPGYMPEVDQVFDDNAIPAHLVLAHFYPSAAPDVHDGLLAQLEAGGLTNRDFVYAWPFVARTDPAPSVARVLEAVLEKTGSAPVLPHASLDMSGISDDQLDFLISVYIASFGRAPEYAGLDWWAGEMSREIESGTGAFDMMRGMAMRMVDGGAMHGETGVHMSNRDYVDHAYLNVLGRSADEAGRHFWIDQLEQGLVRGEFVADFLTATQGLDTEYLDARIQVGRHAAQERVSGPDAPPIDLSRVLDGVGNAAQAYAAILDMQQDVGLTLIGLAADSHALLMAP